MRIGLALIAPVVLLGALAFYQLSVIDHLVDRNREIRLVHTRLEAAVVELREAVSRMAEYRDKMKALGDPAYELAARRAGAEITSGIAALQGLPLDGAEREAVDALSAASLAALAADSLPEGPTIETMHAGIDGVIAASRRESRRAVALSAARARQARRISGIAAVSAVVGAVLLTFLLARTIVVPVRRVAAATRALADGRLSGPALRSGPPELTALADDFNEMARRLEELDRLKDDLLSSVSHDLKAPLASMHETNDLLLEEVLGPLTEDQRNLIRLNQGSNERLSGMVADLLDLSRMEAGAMRYTFQRHDLTLLARTAIRDLAAAASGGRVRIDLEAPTDPVWVDCDEAMMVRVLENLLSNAIRYSPQSACVRCEVGISGSDRAILSVTDAGPGIPAENKERVFERFYRVDSKRKGGVGTGVGLAIVKSVVQDHGGHVWVEDAHGGGSRFVVELRGMSSGSESVGAGALAEEVV